MVISAELQAALQRELASRGKGNDASPEDILSSYEQIYATQGENPFDPFNSADMLIRAFVIAEVPDGTSSLISHPARSRSGAGS